MVIGSFLAFGNFLIKADSTVLKVEDLGPAVSIPNGKTPWLGELSPTLDGKGFVQLVYNYPSDQTGMEVIAVDLQSGKKKRVSSGNIYTGEEVYPGSHAWGPDGKLYLGTCKPGHLLVWDPKAQTITDLGQVWKDYRKTVCVYRLVVGTDNAIYGSGANDTPTFRYDTVTGKLEESPPLGLPRAYYPAYAYSIGADEKYTYVASGKQPWYVVSYDRTTKTQKNLLQFEKLDLPTVIQKSNGVYLQVSINATHAIEYYKLEGNNATKIPSIPPGFDSHLSTLPAGKSIPSTILTPDSKPASSSSLTALLSYNLDQKNNPNAWQKVTITMAAHFNALTKLVTLPCGRLFGSSSTYGDNFVFDPKTNKSEIAGPSINSFYSALSVGGKVYMSGYPNTGFFVYDPQKLYTANVETPNSKAPYISSEASNPRLITNFAHVNDVNTHYGYYMVSDSAGRIYVGAHAERIRIGGGLGIYDPATKEVNAIGEPTFANYDVAGLAATSDGKKIIYSSFANTDPVNPANTPSEAKLFIYDTDQKKIISSPVPFSGRKSTGQIATGINSEIVGLASGVTSDKITLYRFDVATGRVTQSKDIVADFKSIKTNTFKVGPDKNIWTVIDGHLTKIDPATLNVTPIPTSPEEIFVGDLAFVGNDIYLAGSSSLRRIKNVLSQPIEVVGVPCFQISPENSNANLSSANVVINTTTNQQVKNISSVVQSNGLLNLNSPAGLLNTASYNVKIKPEGYLARRITVASNILQKCTVLPANKKFIEGDFNGDNQIALNDIAKAIAGRNGTIDPVLVKVYKASNGIISLSDLSKLIYNYNTRKEGEQ